MSWPVTTAWRVYIGTFSRHQHRIIASYLLSHARSFIVVRSRKQFERARRELEVFSTERAKTYKSRWTRFSYHYQGDRQHPNEIFPPPTVEQKSRMADRPMSNLDEILAISKTTQIIRMTKGNSFKPGMTWISHARAFHMYCESLTRSQIITFRTPASCILPSKQRSKLSFIPHKSLDHRDLNNIEFWEFFENAIGKMTFAKLSL